MHSLLKTIQVRIEILGELIGFLWRNKLWWLMPVITVIAVLMLLIIFGQSTGLAPFIYPLI